MTFPRSLATALVGALVALPLLALAQTQLPAPPQTPYGAPIGAEDAKKVATAALRAGASALK